MTGEKDATAEMPGVEEIGQALAIFFANNRQPCMSGDPRDRLSPLRRRDLDDATSAILALFAPILAEKEALEGNMELAAELALRSEARALAAEAALAAERERCAKVAEQFMAAGKVVDGQFYAGPNTPRAIAAAIRAQGDAAQQDSAG